MNSNFQRASHKRKAAAFLLALCLSSFLNPSLASETAVSRGKKLFEKATCEGCHPGGENLLHPSKVLKGEKFASRYKKDCDIVKVIRSGVPDTGMPSFSKQQLSDAEVKDIIAYIRSLTVPAPPAPVGPKGPKSSSQVGAKTSSSFKNQHP